MCEELQSELTGSCYCRHSKDITDDTLRALVRQGIWRHVLGKAGNSFADLSNISKELAKELQHLKY
jgi:hypothetical protein